MEIGKNVRQISTYSKHVKLLRNSFIGYVDLSHFHGNWQECSSDSNLLKACEAFTKFIHRVCRFVGFSWKLARMFVRYQLTQSM